MWCCIPGGTDPTSGGPLPDTCHRLREGERCPPPGYLTEQPSNCAATHAFQMTLVEPFGGNPAVEAAVDAVYESAYDVQRLLATSDLGRRVIAYNQAFADAAAGILAEHPDLGPRVVQVLVRAISFGRLMERERLEPGSTSPDRRFSEDDFRFGAEVADEIRNVTGDRDLLAAIDDLQQQVERFVGLSPAEALAVLYGAADPA